MSVAAGNQAVSQHSGLRVEPFRLAVPEAALEDLRARLERIRWADELPGTGWDYGVPLELLREQVAYWLARYDWRRCEARLNEHPQFLTDVDGQRLHFLHVRSPEPNALPLILTHGWPGSVFEFLDVIEPLTDPRRTGGTPSDAFDLVVPSLPGFAFSGPTCERGWNCERIADAWKR
jgi:hypothetical protein